jgi:hypothetical protein
VLLAFIPMYFMGLTSNIMSLAGIAISIGVLVDGAIVEVENSLQTPRGVDRGGEKGRLPRRSPPGAERGRPIGVLLASSSSP